MTDTVELKQLIDELPVDQLYFVIRYAEKLRMYKDIRNFADNILKEPDLNEVTFKFAWDGDDFYCESIEYTDDDLPIVVNDEDLFNEANDIWWYNIQGNYTWLRSELPEFKWSK